MPDYWLQVQCGLWDDPKTNDLLTQLPIERPLAVGLLIGIWRFTMTRGGAHGDLSRFRPEQIEMACEWKGRPGALVEALCRSHFFDITDTGYVVHDWDDWSGQMMLKREKKAAAMRDYRAAGEPAAKENSGVSVRNDHVKARSSHVPHDRTGPDLPDLPDRTLRSANGTSSQRSTHVVARQSEHPPLSKEEEDAQAETLRTKAATQEHKRRMKYDTAYRLNYEKMQALGQIAEHEKGTTK